MKSIKTKLMIYFSILLLFVSATYGFLSINTLKNAVTNEVKQALELLASEGSKQVEAKMEVDYTYLEGLANREIISNPGVDLQTKMKYLLEEVNKSESYLRIGVSDLNSNLYLSDSYGIRGSIVNVSAR
ncbi:hypothetical protein [Serpentinicella alkaliphila]|uniref:Uncharacterized protein n=1 Tax=Serpentinicella alkaliphila TaxID=1734049 RepID=A0A4V2T3V9_9FIRM|nr:hypothetical protein [Serpentinicella alkaliphila]QUH24605.1 hypothetical protein HZR23_01550 [Serpentinicella alkaliphila]TCQ02604.1 hypothetical protein EDD79_101418 [Serpentinicella alkaliphila]